MKKQQELMKFEAAEEISTFMLNSERRDISTH